MVVFFFKQDTDIDHVQKELKLIEVEETKDLVNRLCGKFVFSETAVF